MVYWRELGLSYLRFSEVAARELRQAIKPQALSKYAAQGEALIKRHGVQETQAKNESSGKQ